MSTCEHPECRREAQVAPKILVPHAVDVPIDIARQYGVLLGARLCRRCALNLEVKKQLEVTALVDYVRKCAHTAAKARFGPYLEPDFSRARLVMVRLDSAEYRRYAPQLTAIAVPTTTMGEAR